MERPILFSAPMVRAILAGTKTQTRRVVKGNDLSTAILAARSPYGAPGDRLWVRETWAAGACADGLPPSTLHAPTWLRDNEGLWYKANEPADPHWKNVSSRGRWRPSIHMPRWASRITLEIASVHAERLQEISEEDARAEGVAPRGSGTKACWSAFYLLWCEINGHASWDANPWVWALTFKRVEVPRG
jgi:hypothetical protein